MPVIKFIGNNELLIREAWVYVDDSALCLFPIEGSGRIHEMCGTRWCPW
jgi:hypothetical protein